MTRNTRTLLARIEQGARANLSAGSDNLSEVIYLAYELGRNTVLQARFELMDDSWHVDELPKPRRTFAQRVADRMAEIEARFGPATYAGGPVDWETGIPQSGRLERVIV